MAKYSFEFKKNVVDEYLRGEGGYGFLAQKHCISDKNQVAKWVAVYRQFGDDGLRRSRKQNSFPFEFKLAMVESYLSNEISYQELALQHGLNNPALIAKWVRDYRIAGTDALRPHKKGRKKAMDKPEKNAKSATGNAPNTDVSAEYVKELEEELLRLRIENAFLKEARRLRLEDEARMRERRKSSAASEENSN